MFIWNNQKKKVLFCTIHDFSNIFNDTFYFVFCTIRCSIPLCGKLFRRDYMVHPVMPTALYTTTFLAHNSQILHTTWTTRSFDYGRKFWRRWKYCIRIFRKTVFNTFSLIHEHKVFENKLSLTSISSKTMLQAIIFQLFIPNNFRFVCGTLFDTNYVVYLLRGWSSLSLLIPWKRN